MTTYQFKAAGGHRHRIRRSGSAVLVDEVAFNVRALDAQTFVTEANGRPLRVRAIARGDTIYLQLNGRACVIEREDPTHSAAAGGGAGHGDAFAPMPGVIVSRLVKTGDRVRHDDPLIVIESMKLQTTILAPQDGIVAELPYAEGQTFQRGVVLARIHAESGEGATA